MTRTTVALLYATLVAATVLTTTSSAQPRRRPQPLTSGSDSSAKPGEELPDIQMVPVGISDNQTLRIVALNLSKDETPTVTVKFVDSEGSSVLQGNAATIQSGQLSTTDLDRGAVSGTGRVEVRAVVSVTGQDGPGDLRLSLEVFNNATGQTTVLWTGRAGPPPPPDHEGR